GHAVDCAYAVDLQSVDDEVEAIGQLLLRGCSRIGVLRCCRHFAPFLAVLFAVHRALRLRGRGLRPVSAPRPKPRWHSSFPPSTWLQSPSATLLQPLSALVALSRIKPATRNGRRGLATATCARAPGARRARCRGPRVRQ